METKQFVVYSDVLKVLACKDTCTQSFSCALLVLYRDKFLLRTDDSCVMCMFLVFCLVLRKQAAFGFRDPQKNPLISTFLAMVFEKVKPTLECSTWLTVTFILMGACR